MIKFTFKLNHTISFNKIIKILTSSFYSVLISLKYFNKVSLIILAKFLNGLFVFSCFGFNSKIVFNTHSLFQLNNINCMIFVNFQNRQQLTKIT